ncbi:MAG: HAD-IC family P-type ATPase, partial [Spirochaetales bacterium]|nr:HAD-IC family P-type ATPase [Spirochaetales bacterium]
NGILFKNAASLEETGRIDIIALDKTGTITNGEPVVTDILPSENINDKDLLILAASLEAKSEHPLAKAIMLKAGEAGIKPLEVSSFKALPGNGLSAVLDGVALTGGSLAFISGMTSVPKSFTDKADTLASDGKTPLLFMKGENLVGIIAVADTMKVDGREAIEQLRDMGIHTVMLTGDNERTAKAIGKQAGLDEVVAGVLPDGKEAVIRDLSKRGKVAMVGDGINDAPALTRADIGIAIGAGSDVAIDVADVVLMKSNLADVPAAIRLSRATLRNIHQNLFWAFFYNVIGIPIAAGALVGLGITLNPMLGAAAMSLSSFCVVTNALRLNLCRLHDSSHDRKKKRDNVMDEPEEKMAENIRKMNVEGMMCPHCEARVKKALEAIDGVKEAVVSHESASAVVTLDSSVSDEELTKAVTDAGYEVKGIN